MFASESGNPSDVIIDSQNNGTAVIVDRDTVPSEPTNATTLLSFDGITFRGGNENAGAAFYVGSVNATGSVLVNITNCVFSNNLANDGAAIYAYQGIGPVFISVTNSVFSQNYALIGGAIRIDNGATITISNSLFVENEVFTYNKLPGYGGAIVNFNANVHVLNCNFTRNSGDEGGAIYQELGTLFVEGTLFYDNSAYGGGGAIFSAFPNNTNIVQIFNVESSTFLFNGAVEGGAILCIGPLAVTVSLSTFKHNVAQDGGGAFVLANGAIIEVTSSTLDSNTGQSLGGAAALTLAASISFSNCTITNNGAGMGGAFYLEDRSNLALSYCTVEHNEAEMGDSILCSASSVTIYETTFTPKNTRPNEINGVYCDNTVSPACTFDVREHSGDWGGVCGAASSSSDSNQLAGWKVAIIVIFVLVGVALIAAGTYFVVKRRRGKAASSFSQMG